MGFTGTQDNLNTTTQRICTNISNNVMDNVKINENIKQTQSNINQQTIQVPAKYLLWRDTFCKNKSKNGESADVGLKNVIVSDMKTDADISDTVRVTQLANIKNSVNNEISNDTEQSNTGVAFNIQSNHNSTAQSISNNIFNSINESMDYRSNIKSKQSQTNIQNLYIDGGIDETKSINKPIFNKDDFSSLRSQLYGGLDTGPNMETKLECDGSQYSVKCGWKFPDSLLNTEWCRNSLDCEAIGNNIKTNLYAGATISNTFDIAQKAILSNAVINSLSNKTVQTNTGVDFGVLLGILIMIFAIMCLGPFFVGLGPVINSLSGIIGSGLIILIVLWSISFGLFIFEITFDPGGGGCIGPNMCATDDDSMWCTPVHWLAPDGFGCTKSPEYPLEIKP